MAYRIQYGNVVTKEVIQDKQTSWHYILTGICILCLCLVVFFTINRYKDVLCNWLLPGNPTVTKSALTSFAEDIQSGAPMTDAISTFCKEIIEGAKH